MIPLNEQAYRHLQHMILTDQLSYQEIYSETKLSKELGISRTPFRKMRSTDLHRKVILISSPARALRSTN